jgi:hypothetical protein
VEKTRSRDSLTGIFAVLHVPLNTEPYERRSATRTPSEDFLSLRDPFMFPPPVSPGGRSPHSTFISRHSADMATITGLRSTHTISRTKSTVSLPLLENKHTSPDLREAGQTYNRLNQADSRQRRVNSEPLLLLTRPPGSPLPQERSHWSDGSDDLLDYEFLSKIIIYPTDSESNSDASIVSEPTSIGPTTDSHSCSPHSRDASSTQTIPEIDVAESVLETSEVQETIREECEMAHLEVETIRQTEYYPRYGPELKPCSMRPPSPNLWRKLQGY